ncbi:FAD-binding protein, partial [Streptomyces exfoliatus]|uniref:FAD-binding protein n=1 Tax=Streptomyces exfoliatus TaxID=1905 RepID=UPI0012FEA99B
MTNRQQPPPPDAVVVGAGLAGLACALDLRSLRLRPFTPGVVARTRSGRVRLTD